MKDKISIVVPIYNVEDYLDECISSILNQSYENIEILLIDDGSTDKSGLIADKFKEKDTRIEVYHKENGGLADARNYGINRANGKYICFIDSDDIIEKDYVLSMYNNIIKYNTKIAACGMCHLFSDNSKKEYNFQNIKKIYVGNEAQIYLNVLGYYNVSSCNKIFDIELFNDIKFPFGKKSEDWFIMYKLIEKSGSIYYDSDSKYCYRQRIGSITKNAKANCDAIDAANEVYDYFKLNDEVAPYAAQSLAFSIIGVYNYEMCRGVKNKNLKKYTNKLNDIKKKITYDKLSLTRKIQLFLFLYFRTIYNIVFKIYDKRRKKS